MDESDTDEEMVPARYVNFESDMSLDEEDNVSNIPIFCHGQAKDIFEFLSYVLVSMIARNWTPFKAWNSVPVVHVVEKNINSVYKEISKKS